MKNLTIAFLASAAMMTAAVAGPTSSGKSPVLPPPPAPACPGDISYSDVTLDWGHTWLNHGLEDADGVNFDLSYKLVDRLYFHGTASWANTDSDQWGYTAGLGYGIPLVKNLDLAIEAGGIFDTHTAGFYVFPHLRGKLGCLEAQAGAKYINIDDYEAWEAHVNLYYEVAANVDLHVGGIFNEDNVQTLLVGVRYKF
jgi:hypothetical protein